MRPIKVNEGLWALAERIQSHEVECSGILESFGEEKEMHLLIFLIPVTTDQCGFDVYSELQRLSLGRQLGHRGGGSGGPGVSKLVPLVQGLSHQIHLFLVEYNKHSHLSIGCGSTSTGGFSNNLPGYKPRTAAATTTTTAAATAASSSSSSPSSSAEPNPGATSDAEEILHQQRLLLQSCDRLKLAVTKQQSSGWSQPAHTSSMTEVVDVITQLGATFTRLIELMLSKEIKVSQKLTLREKNMRKQSFLFLFFLFGRSNVQKFIFFKKRGAF